MYLPSKPSTSCFFWCQHIAPPPFYSCPSDSSLSFGRTCLTHRWLHPWTLAFWGRPAQLTADPHRAGLPTPPTPPPNGPRAWRGSSRSRHRDTRGPSWKARRQREAVLYLLLPFIHLSLKEPVPQNPLTLKSRDSQEAEPEQGWWGLDIPCSTSWPSWNQNFCLEEPGMYCSIIRICIYVRGTCTHLSFSSSHTCVNRCI